VRRSRLALWGALAAFAAAWTVAWVWGYERVIAPLVDWLWPK